MPDEAPRLYRALPLSAAQLEAMCRPQVFRQALRYARSAHMVDRFRIGSAISARFHGTRGIYSTRIDLEGRVLRFECTCPLSGARDPCKHVIALGMAWLEAPQTFHDLDLTLARFAHMKKGDLITAVRRAAQRIPEIIPILEGRRRE